MRTESCLLLIAAMCMAGSAIATGHGALVLTDPAPRRASEALVTAGHLADDPLIQGKIIAALARFDATSVDDLEGREVRSEQGEAIGAVNSVAVSRDSSELFLVVALEGISIANLREVAVPLRQALPSDQSRVLVPYTKAEMQEMPDVDPWDNDLDELG
ncbi:MAG: PRC-barrel domain-containing protein [Gammaproteobacteria bacterium]|jgi:hypothetical protein|nr:PRC-barrel domain-containing protein [Gammaproteobacteria bacterium]